VGDVVMTRRERHLVVPPRRVMCQPSPPRLSALALLASVPPAGNSAMVGRFVRRDLIWSVKLTYAFIAGGD